MPRLRNRKPSAFYKSRDPASSGWGFFFKAGSVVILLSLGLWTSDALRADQTEGKDLGFAEGSEREDIKPDHGRVNDDDDAINDGNAIQISQDQLSYLGTNQSFRDLRTKFEHWFIKEIKGIILNATGRADATRPPSGSRPNFTGTSNHGGPPRDPGGTSEANELTSGRVPAGAAHHLRHLSPEKRHNNVVEMKFTPDEVSTHRSDACVQFTLHNYTLTDRVEGAELMLLLRYIQPANQRRPNLGHRSGKPEARRVSIEVYKDTGNAMLDGNTSNPVPPQMTRSVFRVRRTKWVKVLLIRGWIREAVGSADKVLRLRLVYDRSNAVDVVMKTAASKGGRTRGKLRRGGGGGGGGSASSTDQQSGQQRIAKRNLGKPERLSPILVIRQRRKSTLSDV